MNKPKSEREKIKETTKRTTARLIKEIAKSEGILAAIGDGISVLDRTFKILYQNKAESDMMGDHVGEFCYKAYAKRQGICGGCPIALTFKGGKVQTVQRELRTDEGTRHFEITASPLKDSKGNIIAGIEVLRDITERKQIENKLREEEERYRLLFNYGSDAIFVHGVSQDISDIGKFKIIEVNDNACKDLGYTREELLQMNIPELDAPETLGNIPQILNKLFTEKNATWEGIHIHKDGHRIPVEISNQLFELYGKPMILSAVRDITKRKRAEELIRESEARYRSYIEVTGQIAWVTNAAGEVVEDVPSLRRFSGQTYEEARGSGWAKVLHPDDIDRTLKVWQNSVTTRSPYEIEYRMLRHDGVYRDLLARGFPVFSEDGRIREWVGTCIDITERKKAEEALKQSELKYKNIIRTTQDGFWYVDTDGRFLDVNDAACKMLGYERGELIKMKISDIEAIEDEADVIRHIAKMRDAGGDRFETKHKRKDGTIVEVEATTSFIKDADNERIFVFVRDITERKQAEEALRESEKRYGKLIDSLTDYLYTVELKNGQPVSTKHGPGCVAVTGYTSEEYEADLYLWYRMVYEEDKEAVMKQAEKIISGKVVNPIEHRIIHKNGEIKWVRNTVVPRLNEEGVLIAYDGLIENITERKRLEEQLLQAQKMESVGQLAGGVAHDFNNLLTAIIGYGNLLKTEVSQDNLLLAYVTQILNSAKRAANLTRNLLAFSRRQMINPKPVNVNNIINSMKSFLPKIIGEDIELSLLLTSKNLPVMADSNQIEHVLMNLATNARDAMPDGGSLTIRTEYRELDNEFIKKHGYVSMGSYALISVEDTGQGMDKETKERIFDPFFTTKEVGKGTGLGLSMVYGMIRQHNGHIDVQSELGKGTTFNIYLPLTTLTVEEDKKPEDLPILKGGNETILVAEDETYVRDFIKEILTGYGYKVIEAIDGEDAIKVLHTHKDKIQLSLLDVIMPKKDGKMVYQEIKKVSPHMKVIFISGYATDILYKKGIIEEDVNFISKPMLPDELLIKVRDVLDK